MRKNALSFSLGLFLAVGTSADEWKASEWPVLRHYNSCHLHEIALPLGGIGTGTVSLGGRGELRDWEIMNVPGKGFSTVTRSNNTPFVTIYVKPQGEASVTSMLAGLLMAAWPNGRLEVPFPYFPESMTGFEYCAAVGMIYEGMEADGLKCIQAIRDRFDGSKRSPFNEPECGHHYARSMASWASILALSGFHYSGVRGTMSFTERPGRYFWSNGYAWGTCQVKSGGSFDLTVLHGSLTLNSLSIGSTTHKARAKVISQGETWSK
jgi:hypothetical protein